LGAFVGVQSPPEELLDTLFESKEPSPERTTFPQDWPAYNAAQTEEKLLFLEFLEDITSLVPDKRDCKRGRPSSNLREMLFACTTKVYECLSSRRAHSDLEIARRRGYLSKTPHFNTVLKYFNKPELTPILKALIRISALPLAGLEDTIAIDASGLSSAFYSRWFDYRFNQDRRVKDWIKVHIACGVKTNIVTSINVTDGTSSDSPEFPHLLQETTEGFRVESVVADKGYSSRKNLQSAWDMGVVPFIPFKSNSTGKKLSSQAWRKMYHYFRYNNEAFMQAYHCRSNVESTFSMLKRKFDNRLFSRNEQAQVNEALAKVLCHNLVVLVHEAKENKIPIDLNDVAHKLPLLHIK